MALPMLQSAYIFKPIPITTSVTQPIRVPTPEYVATRLSSISNYKLRLEASYQSPCLRKLLGHIYVYDAIREHHQSQPVPTSPTASRRREQQLRRRQQSEEARQASLSTVSEDGDTASSSNAKDISAFLDTLPSNDIPPSAVQGFVAFQEAIQSQLATLSQLRLQNASRQLYHMTRDEDTDYEQAVEEYDSNDDDNGDDSDYDSYDGENDWRFEDEDDKTEDGEGSDTDPESVGSEPTSPLTEEPLGCEQLCKSAAHGSYFPVRPMVYEAAR